MSFYNYNYDDDSEDNVDNDHDDRLLLGYIPSPSSPKLINDNVMDELCSYFKLNNLLNMIRFDENTKPKHDITISNTIMNTIINKKLGTITYHYNNTKSKKAYHTYDYPEIYYNKKLYNNITDWIKEEFKNESRK
jgi:hypothetical protein